MPPIEPDQNENLHAALDAAANGGTPRRSTRSGVHARDEDSEMTSVLDKGKRQQREPSLPALGNFNLGDKQPSRPPLQPSNHQQRAPVTEEPIEEINYETNPLPDEEGDDEYYGDDEVVDDTLPRDKEGFVINEKQESDAVLLQEAKEEHVRLRVRGTLSPQWNDADIPPAGNMPISPPERVIRYSISPNFTPRMGGPIRTKVCMTAQELYSKDSERYPFYDNDKHVVIRPSVNFNTHNKAKVVDVCFPEMEMSVAFCDIHTMSIGSMDGLPNGISLRFLRAGQCHSRSLIHIKVRPALADGDNPDRVRTDQYIEMMENFLRNHPVLDFIGAWRHTISYDGYKTWDTEASLMVKRQPGYNLSNIPGYYPNYNGTATVPKEKIWFNLFFANRKKYCRRCKVVVHEDEDCPLVQCHACYEYGHLGSRCTKSKKKSKASGSKR